MQFINSKATKQFFLYAASQYRPAVGFTRVSQEVLEHIDAKVRNMIIAEVKAQPSRGQTIKIATL